MKCPKCVEEGEKSTLHGGGGVTTLMCGSYYYDGDGKHHSHDPNATTSRYRCSRGHEVVVVSYQECGSCDYNKGRIKVEVRRAV